MSSLSRSSCGGNPFLSFLPHTQDPDRLLVLTLAVILIQNHAPIELILVLLYVAM